MLSRSLSDFDQSGQNKQNIERSHRLIADIEGSFAIWHAKIINGHMLVGDVGEVRCGSKVGAIAVLCGMSRRVSQF